MADAYELLTKPTLELTHEDEVAICADLRIKRERYLAGVQDKPTRAAKPKAPPVTAEQKAANTDLLLGDLLRGAVSK